MAGRRPKPTALKKLEGNPGKRPLNDDPKLPTLNAMSCPRHLSDVARKEWHRVVKELGAAGLLTVVDRTALAAYCQSFANWVEAEQELQENGRVMKFDSGYQQVSPWVTIAKQSLAEMRAFMTEFGMTPSSRSRIHVEKPEVEDPFDAFVRRKLDEPA